ncbi:MAG: cache domain-containing protein, partial [Thermodesulfovibrionales bacterium]
MNTLKILALLLMFSLPAMAVETSSGEVVQNDGTVQVADTRVLLNTFTALAEEHLGGIERTLKILAVTEEARSGDWNAVKGLLTEFSRSGINSAAVWYVRTDGSYYTAEKGLTDQNISDRAFFPRLLSGDNVVGDLAISKSTGKRVAVIAVPIRKDGKVIGGLGVSVDVDELSRKLQETMALPRDMVFYALDAKGQTSLHRESSLLFAFPSEMSSKTLKEAVKEMLSRHEGEVKYDFHGERIVVFKRSLLTGWVFALGFAVAPSESGRNQMPFILAELEKDITLRLDKLDADLAVAARGLSKTDLRGPEARKVLRDLCLSASYAVDCAVVDPSGRMITVEPKEYRSFEGFDISKQEQIIRLHRSKKPVFSQVIPTVEGFDAVDIEHPVFSPEGGFMGSVSLLIRPEALLSGVATPLVQGLPLDVWAMQKDGRILYDPDEEEVGRMLFDDPIYQSFPQLTSLGMRISKEKSGSGSYGFLGSGLKKPAKKEAYWSTVGLYDTEWRLVVTHTLAEDGPDGPNAKRDLAELGMKSYEDSLRALAGYEELKEALSTDDRKKIHAIFRKFVSEHYGIYAIQWVDGNGINRYGYPEENSPVNFDFHPMKTPSSKYILKALSAKTESSFEAPLAEGKEGQFFMVPVHK